MTRCPYFGELWTRLMFRGLCFDSEFSNGDVCGCSRKWIRGNERTCSFEAGSVFKIGSYSSRKQFYWIRFNVCTNNLKWKKMCRCTPRRKTEHALVICSFVCSLNPDFKFASLESNPYTKLPLTCFESRHCSDVSKLSFSSLVVYHIFRTSYYHTLTISAV